MTAFALDIGTTKLCALAVDGEDGRVRGVRAAPNAYLPSRRPWERCQSPAAIAAAALELYEDLARDCGPPDCVGITGQMHGILYVDRRGRAVSPLYTWEDATAALPWKNEVTYSGRIEELTSRTVPPGYGLATCFAHLSMGCVPGEAAGLCTIQEYVSMALTGETGPVLHATNAAGLGLWDLDGERFFPEALEVLGIRPDFLPPVTGEARIVGADRRGAPVCVAVGDNQASFLGAAGNSRDRLLVNMGTGGQVSFITEQEARGSLEVRPFFAGQRLMVGASLCGGKAYAILEGFFRQVLEMAGQPAGGALYGKMGELLSREGFPAEPLEVLPLFGGARSDPGARGRIQGISPANFTPRHLIHGFLQGMARELWELAEPFRGEGVTRLVASGNGVRQNPHLARILEETFRLPLLIPLHREEAAFGAALYAMTAAGLLPDLDGAGGLLRYG